MQKEIFQQQLDHTRLELVLGIESGMLPFQVKGLVSVVLRRAAQPETMSVSQFLRGLLEATHDLDAVILNISEGETGYLALKNDAMDAHHMIAELIRQDVVPAPRAK